MVSYLVATNYHTVRLPPNWTSSAAGFDWRDFPRNVVLGFRAIFWRVFTAVYHREVEGQLTLAGRDWRLRSLAILESKGAGERLGLPDDDTVLVVSMLIEIDASAAEVNLASEIQKAGLNEQQFVDLVIAGLADDPGLEWLGTLKHERNFPGRFILKHKPAYGKTVDTLAMFAFHYFGLLLYWQIARDQVLIDLSNDPSKIGRNGAALLTLRKRIINLDRFFLSASLSNHSGVKALARDAKSGQKIRERFRRLPEINERIEKYFEIAAQLSAQRDQRLLNVIVFLIAILGLPVSVMSMMLAISSQAEILVVPDKLIGAGNVQAFILLSFLGSAVGVLWVLLIGMLLRRAGGVARLVFRRRR